MAILLDTDNLLQKSYTGYLEQTLFHSLAATLPHEDFIISEQSDNSFFTKNLIRLPFPPQKGLLAQSKTQKWLTANNVSAFISFRRTLKKADGVKQILIVASSENWDEQYFQKADAIGFISPVLRNLFLEKFPAFLEKCFSLSPIVPQKNDSTIDLQSVKKEFTGDREYFVSADFDLDKEKFIRLLKGFSAFKKMQQSNWKLMVALRSEASISMDEARQLLNTYKYREDVVLTDDNRLMDKIAASYLLITLTDAEIYPVPIAEASLNHIPVIATSTKTNAHFFGHAGIEAIDGSNGQIGDKLMYLYKSEKQRRVAIKNMQEMANTIQMDKATAELKAILVR